MAEVTRPLGRCSCDECRHCWLLVRVCTLSGVSRAPGDKPQGCLYFERRDKAGR